jgi:hypothetical protein
MRPIKIVISVIIAMIMTMYSCDKEKVQEDKFVKSSTETIENDQLTLNKIFEFRDKIYELQKNPTKSDEYTTIDSAAWYLDATMNLSHAFISWEPMKGFSYDSIFISLPKTNGEVGYNELAIAYAEFKQKTKDVCIQAEGENKELYLASMSRKEETTDSLIVKFDITIGKKGIQKLEEAVKKATASNVINEDILNEVTIFPNPNSGEFYIQKNGTITKKDIFIIGTMGNSLNFSVEGNKVIIEPSYKGIILIRLTSETTSETFKLIIE